ncbi:MAG TPA: hypothetical protein VFR36_02935 [Sphingomicrobium sp.]|nr:hypothetical protein [Sphingomicrobium sp.]
MSSRDQDYFRARAEEERRRASQATVPNIANIHLELAAKYDELVALYAPLSDSRDADDSPWEGGRLDAKSRDDFDPDDPALQAEVGERLSAAAARIRRGLEL